MQGTSSCLDSNVTQSTRLGLRLRGKAGIPSQGLFESKFDCQTRSTRAAGGLTCQLQVDNLGIVLPVRAPQLPPPRRRRPPAGSAPLSTRMGCQSTRAAGRLTFQLQIGKWGLGNVPGQGTAATDHSTRNGLRDYLSASLTVIAWVPGSGRRLASEAALVPAWASS